LQLGGIREPAAANRGPRDGEQDAVAAGSVLCSGREKGYDDIYARLDLAPALRDALDELAEPFRSAVILVDVEDLTYESRPR